MVTTHLNLESLTMYAYGGSHQVHTSEDIKMLDIARRAIEAGRVALAYQPIVSPSGETRFHEALIRVIDDSGRIIPAAQFAPQAESMELGRQIDCAGLRIALDTLRKHPEVRLALNMSARSIGYAPWLEILFRETGQDPLIAERLILEITETSALLVSEIVCQFVSDLQMLGISFALDDFGRGYSGMRQMTDLNFDFVKLDGTFTRGIDHNPDHQAVARATLDLCRHFSMAPVAEAVETEEEAAWLVEAGFDLLQGYLLGRPRLDPPWLGRVSGTNRAAAASPRITASD